MLFISVHPLEQTLHFGKIAQSSATYITSSGLCSVLEYCTATELHGANHTEASWRRLCGLLIVRTVWSGLLLLTLPAVFLAN
jgi:hypothetical protein